MKHKKKPKVINILGRAYKIEYKDLRLIGAFGQTKNREALIEIDESLEGKELLQTLLHEYFHAVNYRTGAYAAMPGDIEEIVVDSIATFLVDTYDFDLE